MTTAFGSKYVLRRLTVGRLSLVTLLVIACGLFGAMEAPSAHAISCTPSVGYDGYSWTSTRTISASSGFCVESVYGGNLKFQSDGNLVLYPYRKTKSTWASNTYHRGTHLRFGSNGLLTITDKSGRAIWNSKDTTNGSPYKFDKFMVQVGDSAGTPCWLVGAHVRGAGWLPGTVRGGTRAMCASTISPGGGGSGGPPGGFGG